MSNKNKNEKNLQPASLTAFSSSFIAQSSLDKLASYSKEEITLKLLEVSKEASLVRQENMTLKQKITAIIAELAQAVGVITFPAKISFWWVISNLKVVVDLVRAVIEILKAGRQDGDVPVVIPAGFKNNDLSNTGYAATLK